MAEKFRCMSYWENFSNRYTLEKENGLGINLEIIFYQKNNLET